MSYTKCPRCPNKKKSDSKLCRDCRQQELDQSRRADAITHGETISGEGDKQSISRISDRRIESLEDLISYCQIDVETWKIDKWVCNKWEVGAKNAAKEIVVKPLFQVKVWMSLRREVVDARTEIESLKQDAKTELGLRPFPSVQYSVSEGCMLELDVFDVHVGKLAWGKETGWDSWDVKMSVDAYLKAVDELVARTSGFPISLIVLVTGNDLFNADNADNTTNKGTPQDADGRFHKVFRAVRSMTTEAIERLSTIAPVVVPMVPGNHDKLTVWHLGDSLECWFHNNPNVRIDNDPTQRKYLQFGKNMLMFTHGDKGKQADYPLLMATEKPQMFGSTLYREAHIGHWHGLNTIEKRGVRVRTIPALCAPDAWHSEGTYVGNQRESQAFVWHPEHGLIAQSFFTIPQERK